MSSYDVLNSYYSHFDCCHEDKSELDKQIITVKFNTIVIL